MLVIDGQQRLATVLLLLAALRDKLLSRDKANPSNLAGNGNEPRTRILIAAIRETCLVNGGSPRIKMGTKDAEVFSTLMKGDPVKNFDSASNILRDHNSFRKEIDSLSKAAHRDASADTLYEVASELYGAMGQL